MRFFGRATAHAPCWYARPGTRGSFGAGSTPGFLVIEGGDTANLRSGQTLLFHRKAAVEAAPDPHAAEARAVRALRRGRLKTHPTSLRAIRYRSIPGTTQGG